MDDDVDDNNDYIGEDEEPSAHFQEHYDRKGKDQFVETPMIIKCGECVLKVLHPRLIGTLEEDVKSETILEKEIVADPEAFVVAVNFINTGVLDLNGCDIRKVCRLAFDQQIRTLLDTLVPVVADIVLQMSETELRDFLQVSCFDRDKLCFECIFLYL